MHICLQEEEELEKDKQNVKAVNSVVPPPPISSDNPVPITGDTDSAAENKNNKTEA